MGTEVIKYEPAKQKTRAKPGAGRRFPFLKPSASGQLTRNDRELLEATLDARNEWIETLTNFDYACEEMLIDYYTYRMKACEARYAYFLKQAKEKGLSHYL